MAITATEARRNLFPLLEQVNADRTPVEITSRRGSAYLIAAEEYDTLLETLHLLRSPVNRERLLRSLDDAHAGRTTQRELIDPDTTDQ